MVRGKIVLKRIENAANRLVTFIKRRNGLLKKAFELSVLCDVDVAVIIFSQRERLYEFSSSDASARKMPLNGTLCIQEKFQLTSLKWNSTCRVQHLGIETENMFKKIEFPDVSRRKLLGQGLASCSVKKLQEIDSQLSSLKEIRAQLFKNQLKELKVKVRRCVERTVKSKLQIW